MNGTSIGSLDDLLRTQKTNPPVQAAAFPDWDKVFPQTRVVVPLEHDRGFIETSPAVVRGLFVDLATVIPLVGKRRNPQAPLEIHADVVRISTPVSLILEALTIHARRIEVSAAASLTIDQPPDKKGICTMEISAAELAFENSAPPFPMDFLGVVTFLNSDDMPGCIRYGYEPDDKWLKELQEDDRKAVKQPDRGQLHAVLLAMKINELEEAINWEKKLHPKRMISYQHQGKNKRALVAEHEATLKALGEAKERYEKLGADPTARDETLFTEWDTFYAKYSSLTRACTTAQQAYKTGEALPRSEDFQLTEGNRQLLAQVQSFLPQLQDLHSAVDAILADFRGALSALDAIARLASEIKTTGSRDIDCTYSLHPAPGDPMQAELALQTAKSLQYATNGSARDFHDLALAMAKWVNHCHTREDGDLRLATESALLIERLLGTHRHLRHVPQLQFKEYFELAEVTATALQDVERQADRFFDRDANIADRKAAAEEMLKHYGNGKGLAENLLQQAMDDLVGAKKINQESARKLKDQNDEMTALKQKFDDGVEKKKKELEGEAILGIILAVITVGIGIAQVCMGNPAGAAEAGNAVKKGAEAAEKIGTIAAIMQKIAKAMAAVGKLLLKLVDVEKFLKVVSGAYQGYTMVSKLAKTYDITNQVHLLGYEKKADPEDTMTAADWDVFTVEMRRLFKTPIDAEIEGASEYLAALEKLAIRAKDVIDTALHLGRCQQLCLQRQWEMERDQRDMEIARQRIDQLSEQIGPDFMMLLFCERLGTQLKLQLIDAIENAGDAFRYYALAEPGFRPSIHDTGAQLQALVAKAKNAELAARESFRPPPASWGPQCYRIWAHDTLAELRAQRTFSWTISSRNFKGYDRIRISEIRVWLIPALPINQEVHIQISTSGIYRDRWKDLTFEFGTEPLQRTFTYKPVQKSDTANHRGDPVLITAYADDVEDAYFQPTPFTTWEISVPQALNPRLNLDSVSEIGLEFYGSYIGATEHSHVLRATVEPQVKTVCAAAMEPSIHVTSL